MSTDGSNGSDPKAPETNPPEAPKAAPAAASKPLARSIFHNWISLLGFAVAFVAIAATAVLFTYVSVAKPNIQYIGIGYILFAGLLAAGLAVVAAGALREKYLRNKGITHERFSPMTLDLSRRRERVIAFGFLVGAVVVLAGVSTGAYQSIHYVESNAFCTNQCHAVMHPEGIAHEFSPHSKLSCVECHVGDGADAFVAAKLNGVRQLWGVVTGDYSRPIPTPAHGMRSSREICESCHSRDRWVGYKEKVYTYYAADEENTERSLRLLMKIGGKVTGLDKGEGIHYHMLSGRTVEFVARDPRKQSIAEVRVTEPDGKVKVYADEKKPLTDEERKSLQVHRMECTDCHSRPSHQFRAPMDVMNEIMAAGEVDPAIPGIKKKGVEVLSTEYESTPKALAAIDETLRKAYGEEHQDFVKENGPKLDKAITSIQAAFRRNVFPEMKARWDAYPDNSGHRDSPGCFRCHNDKLVDAEGEAIFSSCTKCHSVLAQGTREELNVTTSNFLEGDDFFHAADEEEFKEYEACTDCHKGGAETYE